MIIILSVVCILLGIIVVQSAKKEKQLILDNKYLLKRIDNLNKLVEQQQLDMQSPIPPKGKWMSKGGLDYSGTAVIKKPWSQSMLKNGNCMTLINNETLRVLDGEYWTKDGDDMVFKCPYSDGSHELITVRSHNGICKNNTWRAFPLGTKLNLEDKSMPMILYPND